jgi:hypothetical protein
MKRRGVEVEIDFKTVPDRAFWHIADGKQFKDLSQPELDGCLYQT